MIDIQKNRPIIVDRKVLINKEQWRGTLVEFSLEGDYLRAMPKILDYFKQTAMVNPYANLTFVDPKGRLYKFTRVTKEMPKPPKETLPHPYGVDVELLQRLIQVTPYNNMLEFLRNHFHRVGEITALKFLAFAAIGETADSKDLSQGEIVGLMHMLKKFKDFLPPDASRLSPLGEELLKAGILKDPKKLSHEEIIKIIHVFKKLKDFLPPNAGFLSPLGEELLKAGILKDPKKLSHEEIVRLMHMVQKTKDPLPPNAGFLSPLGEELLKAGILKDPKKLSHEEIVRLMHMLKKFKDFLPPDASCLSPLGEDLLKAGIQKELEPEVIAVHQRRPATYGGHPFIIEVGIAYGGEIPKRGSFLIYRFANRIPLLYDEASDVSVRVISTMNWRRYHVSPDMPIAILVHICSTKVPYKTVGKEFIADRVEVRREMANGLREVARQIQLFLSRREHVDRERKRLGVFSKYLPKIAQFSTKLAGKEKEPDIEKLLTSVKKYGAEEEA
jgi:DNA topoisomerase-6 subunit B